jgi:hypothetical protein
MLRSHTAVLIRLSLLSAAVACAPSAASTPAASTSAANVAVAPKHDPLIIGADEIDTVRYAYVIDVVKHARPNWLTMNSSLGSGIKRAQGFAVYEDETRVGGLDMLSSISSKEVSSIRFVDTNRALSLPGMGSDVVLGAIILSMKR